MGLDNQYEYWDSVAASKVFTHPVNIEVLSKFVGKSDLILDYGCGYGRAVKILVASGYQNVVGVDTSIELIARGKNDGLHNIYHIPSPQAMSIADDTVDAILLFAVLTCIPSNQGQKNLIEMLHSKLKPGGILYISDYYLQKDSTEMERYDCLNNDADNYGIFTLAEEVTFRHHTREWISNLLHEFEIKEERLIEVKSMNGHTAEAFQIIAQKI